VRRNFIVVNLIFETQIKYLGHFEFSKNTSNAFLHLTMSRNVNYTKCTIGKCRKKINLKCFTYDYITKQLGSANT